jgi:hypothetical protein
VYVGFQVLYALSVVDSNVILQQRRLWSFGRMPCRLVDRYHKCRKYLLPTSSGYFYIEEGDSRLFQNVAPYLLDYMTSVPEDCNL